MAIEKNARIAIVGAGCWGLSTAYHLHKSQYTDITVFDGASELPSPQSAADDLNKIVRAQYDDDFYTNLGLEALTAWKTEDWSPYFHETGHLVLLSGHASQKAETHFNKAKSYIHSHEILKDGVSQLDNVDDIRDYCWQLTGPLTGFHGYYNRREGYAHSGNAVKGIAALLAGKGVKFQLGPSRGLVVELLYHGESPHRRCSGLRTQDSVVHDFDLVICALGAYGAALVPQVGSFNVARCWSVAHVQLTRKECDILRGIPVVNSMDLGFFFEPDPETLLLKLTPLGAGYSNFEGTTQQGVSLPPLASNDIQQHNVLANYVPLEDEMQMRTLLRETLPWLADRPLVRKKMCWFSDTADSEYCIDFVPDTGNSVVVLSGDSGHGFKMMPIFGKWVFDLLERGKQTQSRWSWKSEDATTSVADWGNDVEWRFGESAETRSIVQEKLQMKDKVARL